MKDQVLPPASPANPSTMMYSSVAYMLSFMVPIAPLRTLTFWPDFQDFPILFMALWTLITAQAFQKTICNFLD
jgi:hypothetical protein